jgi:hypothetical protein
MEDKDSNKQDKKTTKTDEWKVSMKQLIKGGCLVNNNITS